MPGKIDEEVRFTGRESVHPAWSKEIPLCKTNHPLRRAASVPSSGLDEMTPGLTLLTETTAPLIDIHGEDDPVSRLSFVIFGATGIWRA
jgi:hypothetical protein